MENLRTNKCDGVLIAKALGILCVVIGHSGCPIAFRNVIYLFHMPLFFFISGYCFKDKYLDDFKTFFIQRIKGLYFPFVKWSFLFIILHNMFFYVNIYNFQYGTGNGKAFYSLTEIFSLLFAALRFNQSEQLLGVFWFVNSLFFGYMAFYVILRFIRNLFYGVGILLLVSFMLVYFKIDIPYLGCKHPISRLDSRLISIYFCDKLKISQLCHNQKNTEKFTNFINFAVQIKI